MIIDGKNYTQENTHDKITIADSFVVPSNKLGNGNGEGKLYIGNESSFLRNFYGSNGFNIKCFLRKEDLIEFLIGLKSEYNFPQLPYRRKNELPSLYQSRLNKISGLPEIIWLSVFEKTNIKGRRIYASSDDKNFKIIRELSLPNLSYVSVMKLVSLDKDIIYYLKLFTNYLDSFATTSHPSEIKKEEDKLQKDGTINETTKEQIIKARIGQGPYREKLLKNCPSCPITLVSDDRLLEASHIKPWAVSNNNERLDPKNGFMFTRTFHHLFDEGFISFDSNKKILVSPWLSKTTVKRLNFQSSGVIEHLPLNGRERYMKYHREHIFKS